MPLSWAEKTTAAIIEAIAPVILRRAGEFAAAADPHPDGHERDNGTSSRPAESPEATPAPVEERQADWSDVAAAVMPRLTQQQAFDIFMQMLQAPGREPTDAANPSPVTAAGHPAHYKKSWFGS